MTTLKTDREFLVIIGRNWGQIRDWCLDRGYSLKGEDAAFCYSMEHWRKLKAIAPGTSFVVLDWPQDSEHNPENLQHFQNWCDLRFSRVSAGD